MFQFRDIILILTFWLCLAWFWLLLLTHTFALKFDKVIEHFLDPYRDLPFKWSKQHAVDLIFNFGFPVNLLWKSKACVFQPFQVLYFLNSFHDFLQILLQVILSDWKNGLLFIQHFLIDKENKLLGVAGKSGCPQTLWILERWFITESFGAFFSVCWCQRLIKSFLDLKRSSIESIDCRFCRFLNLFFRFLSVTFWFVANYLKVPLT